MSDSSNPFLKLVKGKNSAKVTPYSPKSSRRLQSRSSETSPPTTPVNLFKIGDNETTEPTKTFDFSLDQEELFPSLGENNLSNSVSTMDFSKHLTEEQEKPQPEPDKIKPGWAHLHKDGSVEYGRAPDNYDEFCEWADQFEENRIQSLHMKTLERYRRYKIEDEYRFGLPTLQSWEIDAHIAHMQKQAYRERKYNNSAQSDGESSEQETEY